MMRPHFSGRAGNFLRHVEGRIHCHVNELNNLNPFETQAA